MRLFLVFAFVLLSSSLAKAQGSDTLRKYQGQDVTVEEDRDHGRAIKGALIKFQPTANLQAVSGMSRISDLAAKLSPSIGKRQYGSLGGISLLSFRGLPPEYTVVFRDGIRLTNEQNSLTDLARVSAISVERIELLPTTSAILLGGDAIGAAIDLIGPEHSHDRVSISTSSLSYEGLTPGELEHSLSISQHIGNEWSLSLAGTRQYSAGDYPFFNEVSGNVVKRENNDAQLHDLLLNVHHESESLPLTLTASHVRARRGAPGAVTIRNHGASSFLARQNDEDLLLGARSKVMLGDWAITPSLSYQSQYEEYIDPPKRLDEHYQNRLYAFQLGSNGKLSDEIMMYAGLSAQASTLESNEISTEEMPLAKRTRLSGYVAGAFKLLDPLLLTSAVRAEHISDRNTTEVLPQAGAQYEIIPHITARASLGLSYHAPTLNQLHWKTLGNPNLKAEHAENIEAGLSYRETVENIDLQLDANVFSIRSHDQILWLATESDLQKPVNVQDSRSRGVELSGTARIALSGEIDASITSGYTILDATNITKGSRYEGKRLPFSARLQSVTSVLLRSEQWGSFGASANYRGLKYSDLANSENGQLLQVAIFDASYTATDIPIFDPLALQLQLSGQNLTDRRHYEVFGYPLPGRTFKVSATLTYQSTHND